MLEGLARLGYASKALIYSIVGTLAILAALNRGGAITDTSGALRVVLARPFGQVLLLVLGIGLCGYAAWRLLDALRDPDHHGTDFNGLVVRIGNGIRGGIYGALGIEAFRLLAGLSGSNSNEAQVWTARIMEFPLGVWIVGLVGAVVVIYGGSEISDSIRGHDDAKVDLSSISPAARPAIRRISRFGVGARGAIIVTIGVFLLRAALQHDPGEAVGSRQSVIELAGMAEGRWVLAIVAAGLLAYAVDQAVHAKCRRIRPV